MKHYWSLKGLQFCEHRCTYSLRTDVYRRQYKRSCCLPREAKWSIFTPGRETLEELGRRGRREKSHWRHTVYLMQTTECLRQLFNKSPGYICLSNSCSRGRAKLHCCHAGLFVIYGASGQLTSEAHLWFAEKRRFSQKPTINLWGIERYQSFNRDTVQQLVTTAMLIHLQRWISLADHHNALLIYNFENWAVAILKQANIKSEINLVASKANRSLPFILLHF